ncbi:MAG TPA: VWA domain-containing protein [Vicinamibacteria bacterium]|nr:VWA domain-containing protein [Vicinamibacteria bacterium]
MKGSVDLKLLCFFACAVLLAPPAPAQQPTPTPSPAPPTFAAEIEQVTVDAVVTDKKGNPVTDLTPADFAITEDGKPQEVVNFEAIKVSGTPVEKPAARPAVSVNRRPEDRTGRTFVILFDDLQMTRFQGNIAKRAVAEFLTSGTREGDRVMLVATGGGAWWSTRMMAGRDELITLLKRLDGRLILDNAPDRLSDYEAMRIHAYNDSETAARVQRRFDSLGVTQRAAQDRRGFESTVMDPYVRSRAADVYFQAVTRNRVTLQVLVRLLDSLQATKGRKSVILVSQGFIYDPNLAEFKDVVQASRRGNAAVYFLDTRGLEALGTQFSAEFQAPTDPRDVGAALLDQSLASEGSESIASDTGGFSVRNTNDLGKGIQRIANETQMYYLIGYIPTNTARDGRFRKIGVSVKRKGLNVRARKGYYAPLDATREPEKEKKKGGTDPVLQQALDSPFEMDEIPIRMTTFVQDEALLGKLNALVAAEVDVAGFAFKEEAGAKEGEKRFVDTLEFMLVVAHRETGEFYQYNQKIDMRLLPTTRQRLETAWYPLLRDFELATGGYQAKMVVRDKNSGRVGTVIHEFEVPDPAEFRASTLSLTDTLEAGSEATGSPRPVYVARRDFPEGVMLYGQFSVYGAEKDKATGMPKVSAGWQIRAADGTIRQGTSPTVINPTSLGRLTRLVGTSLKDFSPGAYEFVLSVKDEISGKSLEVREPFSVVTVEAPATD